MRRLLLRSLFALLTLGACGDDAEAPGGGGSGAGTATSGPGVGGSAGAAPACDACPHGFVCDLDSGTCAKEGTTWVAAEDGTQLFTWVALPDEVPPDGVPTLLARSPYGSPYDAATEAFYRDMGRVHTARGYAYVLQDVRGRGKSEGTFVPETHEVVDGRTTTQWIAAQPWSNGRVGTIGGSYLGYTALAAAIDNPLVQVVIADDPSNDERQTRQGGTVWTYTLGWLYYLEYGAFPPEAATLALPDELDILGADTVFLGYDSEYWNTVVAHDDIGPWPAGSLDLVAPDACVPALFVYSPTTLWRDPITAYRAFRDLGCVEKSGHQRLVMTPDPHTYHLSNLGFVDTPVTDLMFQTIDHYLQGDGTGLGGVAPVLYAVPGEDVYQDANAYPPTATMTDLFLATGTLVAAPGADEVASLASDPATMSPCGGDYPYLELTTGPLAAPVEIVGEPTLDLVATTDLGDFDVFATLIEYNPILPNGGRLVQLGAQRAVYRGGVTPTPLPSPGTPIPIRVTFLPLAHRVLAGSELVLYLATADCLAFENPQSGEGPAEQSMRWAGTVDFHFGGVAATAPRLSLPVVP